MGGASPVIVMLVKRNHLLHTRAISIHRKNEHLNSLRNNWCQIRLCHLFLLHESSLYLEHSAPWLLAWLKRPNMSYHHFLVQHTFANCGMHEHYLRICKSVCPVYVNALKTWRAKYAQVFSYVCFLIWDYIVNLVILFLVSIYWYLCNDIVGHFE